MSSIHIAVEGCCHGELDSIYSTVEFISREKGKAIELLLVCGDFECIRDNVDLACVAVPPKYRKLTGFDDYVCGRKKAPVLTVFVGGNHEASNVLQELYYGGWVAPNIYYLGFGGVVTYKGIRIGGLSGVYNQRHYRMGHFELPPFSEDSMRSIYHVRELEVFRMAHLAEDQSHSPKKMDIFLSHDWPTDVWNFGDSQGLLRKKKHLADDMRSGRLGSPPLRALLGVLQPSFWFAAHLHVKFSALVPHYSAGVATCYTKFLALDKVLPGRDFLQVLSIPVESSELHSCLHYDPEWLAVIKKTHHLLSTSRGRVSVPISVDPPREEEIDSVRRDVCIAAVSGTLEIPNIDFLDNKMWGTGNKQTDHFLSMLGLNHIWTCPHVPCAASDMDGEQHNNMDKASSSITTDVMPSSLSELPWPDASIDFADLLNHKRMEIGSQLAEHSV